MVTFIGAFRVGNNDAAFHIPKQQIREQRSSNHNPTYTTLLVIFWSFSDCYLNTEHKKHHKFFFCVNYFNTVHDEMLLIINSPKLYLYFEFSDFYPALGFIEDAYPLFFFCSGNIFTTLLN
eukprot:gene12347-8475_t